MRHLRPTFEIRPPSKTLGLINYFWGLSLLLFGSISHAWEASIERDTLGVPHIYGETDVEDADQVVKNWEDIKLKEGKKIVLVARALSKVDPGLVFISFSESLFIKIDTLP